MWPRPTIAIDTVEVNTNLACFFFNKQKVPEKRRLKFSRWQSHQVHGKVPFVVIKMVVHVARAVDRAPTRRTSGFSKIVHRKDDKFRRWNKTTSGCFEDTGALWGGLMVPVKSTRWPAGHSAGSHQPHSCALWTSGFPALDGPVFDGRFSVDCKMNDKT